MKPPFARNFIFFYTRRNTFKKERLSDVLSWAKVEETDEKGKKAGINATVFSYLLAMTDPKEYPYCKPVAYNAVVDTLLSKIERCSDPIDRILHCQTIYKELLHILENEYGLHDGNLLDIHSLGYLLAHSKKNQRATISPIQSMSLNNYIKLMAKSQSNPKISGGSMPTPTYGIFSIIRSVNV